MIGNPNSSEFNRKCYNNHTADIFDLVAIQVSPRWDFSVDAIGVAIHFENPILSHSLPVTFTGK